MSEIETECLNLVKYESGSLRPGIYLPRNRAPRRKLCKRKHTRVVYKSGEINIHRNPKNTFNIFTNYFVAIVEARWRWALLNFFAAYTSVWLLFGTIYWVIAYNHEDFIEDHLPPYQNISNFTPCVKNIYGFTSTFLFSVEVHTTVAYGRRAITLECPQTIIAMCLQCIVSSIFQAIMVGILFAKLARPRARSQTMFFSKHAVINVRDDKFYLIFRVGDMRKSRILNIKPHVYAILFNNNDDDEVKNEIELKVEIDECESTFFLWPVTVVHLIDESSPFYGISAADLLCIKLEVIAVFEGIIESTGQPVQARSSYTECDIFWGHHFMPMVGFNIERRMYDVDFSKLSEIQRVDTPLCSRREYDILLTKFEDSVSESTDIYYEYVLNKDAWQDLND